MADIRQAIFEKLHELEDDYAVKFSRGATLDVNPTDGNPWSGHGRPPRPAPHTF